MESKDRVLIFFFAIFFLAAIAFVSAQTPPAVTGTITGPNGSSIIGANVMVTCEHMGANTTLNVLSISGGTYSVVFNKTACDHDDPLWATATFEDYSGSNNGSLCEQEQCFIPISLMDVQIPEFGLLGVMMIVLIGVGIIAISRN